MNERRYSRLLIPSQPLQVLPELAVEIGLNEAIILQQVHYWLAPDKNIGKVADGSRWIFNTYENWQTNFPFWSIPTIKRTIASLEKRELLESRDDLNEWAVDRTKWYTINYDHPLLRDMSRPSDQNDPPTGSERYAPADQNDPLFIETENTSEITPRMWEEMFDTFWTAYPKKMDKGHARKTWKKKGDEVGRTQELFDRILASVEAHKKYREWTKDKGQFIPYPATWLNGEGWENVIPGAPAVVKPASEMTELERVEAEYAAYHADTMRNFGSSVRVREMSALLRRIEELKAQESQP